jgi:hypothetical protein
MGTGKFRSVPRIRCTIPLSEFVSGIRHIARVSGLIVFASHPASIQTNLDSDLERPDWIGGNGVSGDRQVRSAVRAATRAPSSAIYAIPDSFE